MLYKATKNRHTDVFSKEIATLTKFDLPNKTNRAAENIGFA